MDKLSGVKIVGKRTGSPKVNWEQVDRFLKLVIELDSKNRFTPRGTYKFKNHSDNDVWTIKVLANQ